MIRKVAGLTIVTLSALCRDAFAEQPDWAAEKAAGDAAMEADRATDALVHYENAARIRWSPVLDYNRGMASFTLKDYASALTWFESFEHNAPLELRAKVVGLKELSASLRKKVASLVIDCSRCPPAVRVGIGNQWRTGVGPFYLKPGDYTVDVSAHGFESFITQKTLNEGEKVVLAATLVPRPASFRIVGAPAGATACIDGQPCRAVSDEFQVSPGPHAVKLRAPGYADSFRNITFEPGQKGIVDGSLRKDGTIFGSPWFWGGTVLAAAAGVVVAVAATSGAPPEGSLATFDLR
jgi:hypothetical protein